ncbi:MAG: TerC family protein [Candidatus Omnitrophica bacterium]|nr:TerC family protein [Candidatus Omnitrophota bacterium]
MPECWLWIGFNVLIFFLLYLDLFVFNRNAHEIKIKEALVSSLIWIIVALIFNAGVFWFSGKEHGFNFLTGYVLERSLSIDNLFVFLLIFTYFQVPAQYQHKILFWGILGTVVTRAAFILGGIAIIERFQWILYLLGVVLIFSGFKLLKGEDKEMDPGKNPVLKVFKRFFPVTTQLHGGKFFVREEGRLMATPLFVVLLVMETTDVVFAVDSIPAILSITRDPFIVYSSNVFAILGLRALYFALAGLMQLFQYLNYGLGVILMFVGVKMLVQPFYHISVLFSLGVIVSVLTLSIIFSLIFPKNKQH